jgi:hypothetical protein
MLLAGVLLALSTCAPPARPLVAEILYDAIGDDTGHEYVELFNPTDQAWPLVGLRLESGDGAGPGRWTLRWTGAAGDTIRARGRFVIGGAQVTPAPDAVASLDLQNGPDALRLVWPDGASEVVGWGSLDLPEYFCGATAADVASGEALARVPDAADRGSNALDFRAAVPSPGRANQPDRDAAVLAGSLVLDPPQPAPGTSARLSLTVINRGATDLAPGDVKIAALSSAADLPLGEVAVPNRLAPEDSARVAMALVLPAGKQWLRAQLSMSGDESPENDGDSLRVRAGPGPLALMEIQFHPAADEGEWVEVLNRSGAAIDPLAFTISDRGATRGRVGGTPAPLPPDSLGLFAQDRRALLVQHPELDPARVWTVSPWAALNDRDDSTGVADAVVLREDDGTPCDRWDYSSAGADPGVTVEQRADGSWGPGLAAGGTPLSPPRPPPTGPLRLSGTPRRVLAGQSVELRWTLPWATAQVTIELYDLAGRLLATPLPRRDAQATGSQTWRVGDVPAGLYLLAMRASDPARAEVLTATQPLRVDGRVP